MEVALDVEINMKEPRPPSAEDNRNTKKVKLRDKSGPHDENMTDHVDGDTVQDGMPVLQSEQENPPQEATRTVIHDALPAHAVTTDHSPNPTSTVSFRDKLRGAKTLSTNHADTVPTELIIQSGDVEVQLDGLIPSITFSDRIKTLMSQCMRYAVIVKLLGRFVRQDILHSKLSNLWKPSGGFKLTELEGGCYMVKLDNADDYQNAILGGPWVILGHYLTVHPWEPSLSPTNLEIKQVFGWVRLPGLPYHYYHKSILRAIGEVIGQVVRIDYNTEGFDKARYARLAVRIDLTKPLVSKLKLDGLTQLVEYEGLPTICYNCGCYGHLEEACPPRNRQTPPTTGPMANDHRSSTATVVTANDAAAREERAFGEWMKVKPRNGRHARIIRNDQDAFRSNAESGSRFNLLASLDSRVDHEQGNPRTEFIKQHAPVNVGESSRKPAGRGTKGKSTANADKPSVSNTGTTKAKTQAASTADFFDSPAYKEACQVTSLGPSHTAVVLTNTPSPSADMEVISGLGPNPARPTPPMRAGKSRFPPKGPDRPRQKNGLNVNTNTKFKVSKFRVKDTTGGPSGKLSKDLVEALGRPSDSDDELSFAEANELDFVDETVSELSEKEQ